MKCAVVPVTLFQQNCAIIWCEETMKGAVVDPGGDLPRIQQAIGETGIEVEKILLTHGHVDHAAGAGDLAEAMALPIEGPHLEDTFLIEGVSDFRLVFAREDGRITGIRGEYRNQPSDFSKRD